MADERNPEIVNEPRQYTAKQDFDTVGVEDDNNTINVSPDIQGDSDVGAAFNTARTEYIPDETGEYGVTFNIVPGVYDVTTTFDMTNLDPPGSEENTVTIDARGVFFRQQVNQLFDLTGANHIRWFGGRIDEEDGGSSDLAFLLARSDQHTPSTNHKFYGVFIQGKYQVASVYNVTSERNDWFGCNIQNKSGSNFGPSGSAAVVIACDNPDNVSSQYTTIDPKATANMTRFHGGSIFGNTGVHIRPAGGSVPNDTMFYGVYFEASSESCLVDLSQGDDQNGLHFLNCRGSDSTPDRFIDTVSPNSGTATIDGLTIRGGAYISSTDDILLRSGVDLKNANIKRDVRWTNNNGIRLLGTTSFSTIEVPDNQTITLESVSDSIIRADSDSEITYNSNPTRVMEYGNQQGKLRLKAGGDTLTIGPRGAGTDRTYNLSNQTGDYDGQMKRDDGTNLTAGEYAYWDAANSLWRAFSDPANSTV